MDHARKERYGEPLARIERTTELPMLVLAVAYVPLFVIGYVSEAPGDVGHAARLLCSLIVAAFAVELAVKVAVARGRLAYLRENWLDVVIVLVPVLRPLRIFRVLRVLPFVIKGLRGVRTVLGDYSGIYVIFVGVVSVLLSSFVVFVLERGAGGDIQTFGEALWWAAETVTTVGYGDVVPVTTGGRVVATVLMVVGIALFGLLTAGVAAYFVHPSRSGTQDEQMAKILARFDALEARLGSVEAKLDGGDVKRRAEDDGL